MVSADPDGREAFFGVDDAVRVGGFDIEAGEEAIEPPRQVPVRSADEVHDGGEQEAADDQGVDEDGEAGPERLMGQRMR